MAKHIWITSKTDEYEVEYCKVCNVVKYSNPKFSYINDKECPQKPMPKQYNNKLLRRQ